MRRLAVLVGFLLLAALTALAQVPGVGGGDQTSDNGFLINFLENRISAPGRQIRLSGVTGALSSQARIERITISDQTGPYIEIDDVEIDWSRAQLLLARLNVNRLSIGRVAWLRRPVPPAQTGPRLPQPEATPFRLPELPVSVNLRDLSLGTVVFDQSVFGMAAELSAQGNLSLAGGALDADLSIERQDGPGGELDLRAAFANATRQLDLDLNLREPEGGVVATLLRIEGTPAIDLRIAGSGPLDSVDIDLTLDAGGARLAGGTVALRGGDEGLGFDAELAGAIAPLVPAEFRDFFAGETAVAVRGVSKAAGGLRIDRLDVTGAALVLGGRVETAPGWLLTDLDLTGRLGDPAADPVVLPVPGGDTRLTSATLRVDFGTGSNWSGLLVLDRLEAGGIAMEDVTLNMGGRARNLQDPGLRDVTIVLEGLATGITSPDPAVSAALGTRMDLFADLALVPGGSVNVRQLQFGGNGIALFTSGRFAGGTYGGRGSIRVADLAVLEGVSGRPLTGALNLQAEGSVTPLDRAFDLTLDGGATDLAIGEARIDRLLAGETTLSGRAVRDETGFRTEDLRLANPQVSFASNGSIATGATDFGFDARLEDLALLDPRATGALSARGRANSAGGPIAVTLTADLPEGTLLDRRITGLGLAFDGTVAGADLTGRVSGRGALDGLALDLGADLALAGERRSLSDLRLAVGPNLLTGAVAQQGTAPVTGDLSLTAPEIAPLAALALIEASGALDAEVTLTASDPGQGVGLAGSANALVIGANRIGALDFDLVVTDALGLPLLRGTANGRDIAVAGLAIDTVSLDAEQTEADRMRVTAQGRLAVGTEVTAVAGLERLPGGFAATVETLRLRQAPLAAQLVEPATVTVTNGTVTLTPLLLDLGTGRISAQGSVADQIDISVDITDLHLDHANMVLPGLGLGGLVTGTARVTGPRAAPDVRFDLSGSDVITAQTVGIGLPPMTVAARGQTRDGRLAVNASLTAPGGLAATVEGTAPLGAGTTDLRVAMQSFPLALVDRLAGNRGLAGTVTGTAHVGGALASPVVTFDLSGTGVGLRMLRDNGLPDMNVTAHGEFHAGVVTLTQAEAGGTPGLALSASGRIPLRGPGLDLRLAGTVPLSVADTLLAGRSAQIAGALRIDATLRGALNSPQFSGDLSLAGGTLVDPETNVRLEQMRLDAGLEGTLLRVRSFGATVPGGGAVTSAGTVVLDAARGFPADLSITLDSVRYTDGAFVTTVIAGALNLDGPILGGGGVLSGRINLGPTEISISEGLGFSGQANPDQVTHIRPPARVLETLRRAQVGGPNPPQATGRSGLTLDLRVVARNQIFVRGRGLDAELGGEVRLLGPTTDIQPVGEFNLRRGRIVLIGQRIEFQEGSLQLVGDLDPRINFVARTRSEDVTAIVTVSGRVSSPEITFSSEPPLPEDEVLSRILFNRATQSLSPFQAAQLAAAAAELAGGGGDGLLAQLRNSIGLDDLDIITDEQGDAALRAGRYVSEEVYVDVQTDSAGDSKVEVTYEINERLTARGSVATDGNTVLGIFFERDF